MSRSGCDSTLMLFSLFFLLSLMPFDGNCYRRQGGKNKVNDEIKIVNNITVIVNNPDPIKKLNSTPGDGGNGGEEPEENELTRWCRTKRISAMIDGWCFAVTETKQLWQAGFAVCNRERNGRMAMLSTASIVKQVNEKILHRGGGDPPFFSYHIGMQQQDGPNKNRNNWYWMKSDGVTVCKKVENALPWYPTRPSGLPDCTCGYLFDAATTVFQPGEFFDSGVNTPAVGTYSDGACYWASKALCQYGSEPTCQTG